MTTILLKRSLIAGTVPTAGDLEVGEVGVNVADGAMYTKNGSNDIVLLGGLQDGSTLPTSDPEIVGALWNDNGTVRISDG